jgi:tetratricopeptide (TPR) repeat protein
MQSPQSGADSQALSRPWKAAIFSAASAALVCKVLLALDTYGSNDVYAWERFAQWSRIFGSGIYAADPAFNHPPSMSHVLQVMTWLAKTTGIFFPFWLRLPAILADSASIWILLLIFRRRLHEPSVCWTLFLVAISPTLILVSGFHGNTDPVVMFFVLLSVWLTDEGSDWTSGAALGAAMCVKVLPLIVLPVLFFYRPTLRRRAVFLVSALPVILICWSPYLFRDPLPVLRQVVGYQSIYGHWGLSWLAWHLTFFRPAWHDAFQHAGAYVVLTVILAAAFFVNRSPARPPLYAQAGASLFFFLAASNGFGTQYLAWLVPWMIGLGIVPVAFFTAASGAFLLLVYNYWSGGFPWYLADSNYVGDFSGHLDYALMLCWISVIVLACASWRRRPPVPPSLRAALVLSALAIPLVAYPTWKQLRADARSYPPSVDHDAIATVHAAADALLSQQLFKMGRYTEAVVAARTGVALDPAQLDAWNNLSRACISLGRWDEAVFAANSALELSPGDQDAQENLMESLGHR